LVNNSQKGDMSMTGSEIRIIAGILFVILLGALIWRRGSKTPS